MNSPHRPGESPVLKLLDSGRRKGGLQFVWTIALMLFSCTCLALKTAAGTDVPEVKADIGPCSAEFTVVDKSGKPIYDAKIHVVVRYGFMEKRKQDLEIGTNGDGKARFTGLPIKLKRPLEYKIRSGQMTKSVMSDPGVECHATEAVTLGSP